MDAKDVTELPGNDSPVLCADGKMGMLILYPIHNDLCGVQVHGEEGIRWISCADLTASSEGALKQKGGAGYAEPDY